MCPGRMTVFRIFKRIQCCVSGNFGQCSSVKTLLILRLKFNFEQRDLRKDIVTLSAPHIFSFLFLCLSISLLFVCQFPSFYIFFSSFPLLYSFIPRFPRLLLSVSPLFSFSPCFSLLLFPSTFPFARVYL